MASVEQGTEVGERVSDSGIRPLIAASLEYDATLEQLAQAAVPGFADWCHVCVLEEDGSIRTVAIAHADPERERQAWDEVDRYPLDPDTDDGPARVIRTGEPQVVPHVAPDHFDGLAHDREHLAIIRALGIVSGMAMPLKARGRTLGAISFLTAESGRRYGQADVELAQKLTTRASALVDNARLYTQLRRSHEQLRIILDGVDDGIIVQDRESAFVFVNDAAAEACGFGSADELMRTPGPEIAARFEMEDEDGRPVPLDQVPGRRVLAGEPAAEMVMRWREHGAREQRWSHIKARAMHEDGELAYVITIFSDITEMRMAEQERSATKFRGIVESAPDALVGVDADGRIAVVNEKVEALFGYSRAELLGKPMHMLWPRRLPAVSPGPAGAPAGGAVEHTGLRRDGSEFPAEVTISPIETEDGPLFISIVRDVTERKRAEERIAHLAFHDALTGLPNRSMLEQHLELALTRARRGGQSVALLYVDLDEFKVVNDSLGHAAGDELLVQVARRLASLTRESDLLARQGGDEFLVLVADLDTGDHAGSAPSAVARVAERIHWALRDPFTVEGRECRLGASVGVSVFPHDAGDAAGMLRHADAALYNGKALGRGATVIYADDEADPMERLSLTTRLRRAVEGGEFVLHYQPVVDLRDGRIVGAEALVRWIDPERGMIPPLEFIPAAEALGLIERIGEWVFDEACRQVAEWRRQGEDVPVSINLSLRQVWQADLAEDLLTRVRDAGLDPGRFVLELTESTAMTDSVRGEQAMRALADAGFRLAIDDFGTGYSSLARLREMPVDILKIDRSFVADAHADASIVRTIVELARNLGLRPLAEGIETPEQWRALLEAGCVYGQGFLFARPVPAAELPTGAVALPH
ncbi:MAG: EAL domain-containing protein [Thermoleophilaceae bacterium]